MSTHVALVMGGWSSEREISLISGGAVSEALDRLGYRVSIIDAGRNLATQIAEVAPDVIFNSLHGRWGEDGCVQGLFEVLDIPYTHSGVMASAIAMNKPVAKQLFEREGICCPAGAVVTSKSLLAGDPMARPFVVKPINEGSSVGVCIVKEGDNALSARNDGPWREFDEVLVEQYVPGREVTAAVMGDRPLAVTELRPKQGFYDYDAKYEEGLTEHLVPAPVPQSIYEDARRIALAAHNALQCRGVSRADFRYDDTEADPGTLYLLEVNTQPGMTPLSLVPEMAAHDGIDFDALVDWMVKDASCQR